MTRKLFSRAIAVTVCVATGMSAAPAVGPVAVPWNEICRVAGNRELSITKQNGETVQGHCSRIDVDEIVVATKDHRLIRIARSGLLSIRLVRRTYARKHALASLRKGMHEGFRNGFEWLFSPYAPLGLVVIPATLAWGAVAAPFCLIGEFGHTTGVEIEELHVL